MKEKPILFSTPMVKAILEGRKTMTRRVINPQPEISCTIDGVETLLSFTKQRYKKDDVLWVRETWRKISAGFPFYEFRADKDEKSIIPWKPSIHMPREAARLFLEVKAVRIERLQDITREDAEAEGVEEYPIFGDFDGYEHVAVGVTTPRQSFQILWDSLNAKRVDAEKKPVYSWESNPWVWVIEFERVK